MKKKYAVKSPLKLDHKLRRVGDTLEMEESQAQVFVGFHILEEIPAKEQSLVPTLQEYVAAGHKAENYESTFFGLKPGDVFDPYQIEAKRKAAEEDDPKSSGKKKK